MRDGLNMKEHVRPLEPSEINARKDEDIDFSGIPELDGTFFESGRLSNPRIGRLLPRKSADNSLTEGQFLMLKSILRVG